MKQLFLFLLIAAGMATAACKKDRKPRPEQGPVYTGTPNAVSGVWSMDRLTVYSLQPVQFDYGFGTNSRYEMVKRTTSSAEISIEKGSYTVKPVLGTPDTYIIQLQTVTGNAYTINVTKLSETYAFFEQPAVNSKLGFSKR